MFDYSIFDGKRTRYVTLCVAEFCNLKCSYCYEYHKTSKLMSAVTAKIVVDKEFSDLGDDEVICLDFFGGEPFLGFETIKYVDGYLKEKYNDKNYMLFATTNGTLVHGEIQNWLDKRPYFICSLSLDGDKYSHDINRDNSFEKIDLNFFAEHYPEQEIKMTISAESLPYLYHNIVFCHEKGFRISANLAFGIEWGDKNKDILEKQLNQLIDYYVENPDIAPASILNFDITAVAEGRNSGSARKWCGTGDTMHTYDADGNLYACQFFMPISLGERSLKAEEMPKIPQYIPLSDFKGGCKNCSIIDICPMCYGSNYSATGDFFSVDEGMCKMTKMIMKARSLFRAKQLEKNQLPYLTLEEKAKLIDSIMIIQDSVEF